MCGSRFQFGIQSALIALSAASVLMAIAAAIPRGFTSIAVVATGISVIVAGIVSMERRRFRHKTPQPLALASIVLTSISIWILTFVVICRHLPGGLGPIQYTGGMFFPMVVFQMRAFAFLLLLLSPTACGIWGAVRLGSGIHFQPWWLVVAIAAYALAFIAVWYDPEFVPMA